MTDSGADGRVIGVEMVAKLDITLMQTAGLPPGWTARRDNASGPWHREKSSS